jgi:hypothetical protein
MSNSEFHAKYRAHKAHMEAVPGAMAQAKLMIVRKEVEEAADVFSIGLESHVLRTLVAEVERLQAQVKQQQADAIEAQREFSREARDIAAQARWDERESSADYGNY